MAISDEHFQYKSLLVKLEMNSKDCTTVIVQCMASVEDNSINFRSDTNFINCFTKTQLKQIQILVKYRLEFSNILNCDFYILRQFKSSGDKKYVKTDMQFKPFVTDMKV